MVEVNFKPIIKKTKTIKKKPTNSLIYPIHRAENVTVSLSNAWL